MALFVRLFAQKVTAKICPVVRLVSMVNHQTLAKPSTSSGANDSRLKNTASVPTKLNRNRQEQKHLITSL